jgi:hypothetical protein
MGRDDLATARAVVTGLALVVPIWALIVWLVF